jgi:hypothetical protein
MNSSFFIVNDIFFFVNKEVVPSILSEKRGVQ